MAISPFLDCPSFCQKQGWRERESRAAGPTHGRVIVDGPPPWALDGGSSVRSQDTSLQAVIHKPKANMQTCWLVLFSKGAMIRLLSNRGDILTK